MAKKETKKDIKVVNRVVSTSLEHDIPLEKMAATANALDLKEHMNDTTSEQIVIDCSKIPKLSTLQTDLLNQIAELCKDANVQLRLDSEQIGLTDYLRAICEDTNSDALAANESSAPGTISIMISG